MENHLLLLRAKIQFPLPSSTAQLACSLFPLLCLGPAQLLTRPAHFAILARGPAKVMAHPTLASPANPIPCSKARARSTCPGPVSPKSPGPRPLPPGTLHARPASCPEQRRRRRQESAHRAPEPASRPLPPWHGRR